MTSPDEFTQFPSLPPELQCQIIGEITDLPTIQHLWRTSLEAQELIRECVRHLNVGEYVELPLSLVLQLRHLETTRGVIPYTTAGELMMLANLPLRKAYFQNVSSRDDDNKSLLKLVEYFVEQYCGGPYLDETGNLHHHHRNLKRANLFFWMHKYLDVTLNQGVITVSSDDPTIYGFDHEGRPIYEDHRDLGLIYPLIQTLRQYQSFRGLEVAYRMSSALIDKLLAMDDFEILRIYPNAEPTFPGMIAALLSKNRLDTLVDLNVDAGNEVTVMLNTQLLRDNPSTKLRLAKFPVNPDEIETILEKQPNLEVIALDATTSDLSDLGSFVTRILDEHPHLRTILLYLSARDDPEDSFNEFLEFYSGPRDQVKLFW
jgi:hypothetical protein